MKKIYRVDNCFTVRTPIFSEELLNRIQSKEDVISFFQNNKIFQESVLLATHNLLIENKMKYTEDILLSIYKYIVRSTSRSTPYGLFSGLFLGEFSNHTNIVLNTVENHTKGIMADMEWIEGVIRNYINNNEMLQNIYVQNNPNCYVDGVFLKNPYIVGIFDKSNKGTTVSVIYSDLLKEVLNKICVKMKVKEVISFIQSIRPGIEREVVEEYLKELINNEIILTELVPPLVNCNPLFYIEKIEERLGKKSHLHCIKKMMYDYQSEKPGIGIER